MLLHHALTEPAAENRAYQNRDHGDEERAGVDVVEHAIDVCRVPATRLKARRVGVLHEPQGQNRAGQAVGEHHIADEQQRLALVFAGAGDEIGGHREYDAGDKRKHEMSGNEKEQADDHAHDGDAAELAESRGQQHVHAAGDEGCNGRQEDGAEAAGNRVLTSVAMHTITKYRAANMPMVMRSETSSLPELAGLLGWSEVSAGVFGAVTMFSVLYD